MRLFAVYVLAILLVLSACLWGLVAWIRYQPVLEIPEIVGDVGLSYEAVLQLDLKERRHIVDERFLSFAIDSSQVVGGHWWKGSTKTKSGRGDVRTEPFDFGNEKLRMLAKELSPAFLRVGGSDADELFYKVGRQAEMLAPAGYGLEMTESQWVGLMGFVNQQSLSLMFTLNAGPSTRDDRQLWTRDNAAALLEFAMTRNDAVPVWELGNEINAFWHLHGFAAQIDAETYLKDLTVARELVREYYAGSRLAGPSSAYWPVIGEPLGFLFGVMDEVTSKSRDLVDIVTWHYYPSQSFRCPTFVRAARYETLLIPKHLNEVGHWAQHVESLADRGKQQIWLGETGPAQCGGEPGVSTSFAGAFWWMDQLGHVARRGQQVVVRQTLVGSDYGMLADDDLTPRPDFWTSVLWKRLMGPVVLTLDVPEIMGQTEGLRAYAHCGRKESRDKVSLLLLNLNPKLAAHVRVPEQLGDEFASYVLTAEKPRESAIRLNGVELVSTDDALPDLAPRPIKTDGGKVSLPPLSMSFLVSKLPLSVCDGAL